MKNDASINDQAYWDQRFRQDWEELAGPRQSRFFSALALEHLPPWLLQIARRDGLTIADWGCAQGDGTELLASGLAAGQVTGIDFSTTAIEQARSRYPQLRFVAADWLAEEAGETYDIVFSSNTLEHFHSPLQVLGRIARRASKAVLLALPYRELDRHPEHFFSFLPHNIPLVLDNGFRLVWSRTLDCRGIPGTSWPGEQVFLAYANPQWLDDSLGLTLQDCVIEHGSGTQAQQREIELRAQLEKKELDGQAERRQLEQQVLAAETARAHTEQRALAAEATRVQLERRVADGEQAVRTLEDQVRRLEGQLGEARAMLQAREADAAAMRAQLELQVQTLARTGEEQAASHAASLGELQRQNSTLKAELDARGQELLRVSNWASQIATHPAAYAVKRSSYLVAREIFRLLPLGTDGKLRLKGLAYRFTHRAEPARPDPALARSEQRETSVATQIIARRRIEPHQGERDVFVFAVIDWHFRIQRPQHLARGLAAAGRRVFYVSNNFVDAQEPGYALERLDGELDLFQVKLHVTGAPAIYFAPASEATVRMLQASMAVLMADFGALSSISVMQHSFWLPLVQVLPNSLRVYDCMDHHEGFGNVPEELVKAEHQMLRGSDLVVVTSSWLHEFASAYNRNVSVVRNAVEYEFFATPPAEVFHDPKGRRIIGYFGAIAEWFDLSLVRRVALAHPECLVLLVGNDTVKAASQLADLPNVQFTGEVPYRELPHYLYAFDVCLLPFQVTPLTLATNPVKVYEYLAAGKAVVCVDLPEVAQFGDCVYKAADPESFVQRVGAALAEQRSPDVIAQRRGFAAQQTWAHRAAQFQQAIAELPLPKVSVVVLTYNNLDLTKACLDSVLRASDYPNLELVLVDNASTDGSPEYLRQFAAEHPGTVLILNDQNLGFAAGNNVGLAAATGEYLVILNNDTVVTRGWAMTMLRHLQQDASIGLIGPMTNNIGNAARVETNYSDIADMQSEASGITLPRMGSTFPLRTAAFFCVMLHRAVYDACGPMSEEYGRGFFEDDDYCRRVEHEGLRVVCAEDVFVHHHLSASFNKLPSAERQALFERNRVTYESKWGAWVPHTYERDAAPAPIDPLERAAAGGSGKKFLFGQCTVCGHATRFSYTDRGQWHDSLTCQQCSSSSGERALARGVLRAVQELCGVASGSLATLPRVAPQRRLRVGDAQAASVNAGIAGALQRTGWITVVPLQGAGMQGGDTLDLVIAADAADRAVDVDVASLRRGGIYLFESAADAQSSASAMQQALADAGCEVERASDNVAAEAIFDAQLLYGRKRND